jgi:hypothetical protein
MKGRSIPKKIAIGGHIHECLTKASLGFHRFTNLRSNESEAREIQMCLVFGWLRREFVGSTPIYYITERGYEILEKLGPYRIARREGPLMFNPRKAIGYVDIPKHHTPVQEWVKYFETRWW